MQQHRWKEPYFVKQHTTDAMHDHAWSFSFDHASPFARNLTIFEYIFIHLFCIGHKGVGKTTLVKFKFDLEFVHNFVDVASPFQKKQVQIVSGSLPPGRISRVRVRVGSY
jgi:hypothetical protein